MTTSWQRAISTSRNICGLTKAQVNASRSAIKFKFIGYEISMAARCGNHERNNNCGYGTYNVFYVVGTIAANSWVV